MELTHACSNRFLLRAIIACSLGSLAILFAGCYSSEPEVEEIKQQEEWPNAIANVIHSLSSSDSAFDRLTVLDLDDSTYAVVAIADKDAAKVLAEHLDARKQDVMPDLFRRLVRQLPKKFREGFHSSDCDFYLSQHWLAGEEGDLHAFAYDRKSGRIVWWCYYNS